jgi:nicotinate-nucleotide pyrophosphorylase (carboxylating)
MTQQKNTNAKFDQETASDTRRLISLALVEDLHSDSLETGLDCTTRALFDDLRPARASFVSRRAGVVCGIEVCKMAIESYAKRLCLEVSVSDGMNIDPRQVIATISGPARDILMVERTCLNFMGRLSGISTLTRQFVSATEGTKASVYDTRKTTPGWRRLEKYAVACGGGKNHRVGLFDAILIKDNHLAFFDNDISRTDDIPQVICRARKWIVQNASQLPCGKKTIVQLEVDSLEQLEVALNTDCDIILLDNMSLEQLRIGVELRNRIAPRIELEASGGVNLQTIEAIAKTGVERISVGALTHSAINFDIGLDWA